MLRANLYKKFSKSNLPKAVDGVKQDPNALVLKDNPKTSNWGEAKNFQFSFSNPNFVNISDKPGTLYAEANTEGQTNITGTPTGSGIPFNGTADNRATAKLPNLGVQSSLFENMSNPEMVVRGAEPGTRKVQTPQGEVYMQPGYIHSTEVSKTSTNKTKAPKDYNSLFTLGLGLVDMGLGFNEDLRNRRDLQESIQNRDSKPVYDYNYMYGRTTSGGTEYQPTIKAEMGAKITKRQDTPYGVNNVEVEGGEFIQLPNFDTEYAEGPSHEQGGVKTNLPENTRVYSDHLKPEGSKKTFAQLAKKYDISGFKQVLDSPFKKQVDKDTATIMMTRNQKKLDELFNLQQSMNGNSNGEMRDGGIHNPGFQALPKAVQEKILANMEYGGYALPEYGVGGNTIVSNSDKSVLPADLQPYAKWDSERKTWRVELPDNLESDKLRKIATAAEQFGIKNLVQSSNQRLSTSSKQYQGFYGGMKPQDYEKRIVEEKFGKDALKGLDEVGVRKKAFELLGIDSAKYDVNDAKKLYNDKKFRSEVLYPAFKSYLPAVDFRKDQGDDFKLGLEHYDAIKTPEAPKKTDTSVPEAKKDKSTVEEKITPPTYQPAKGVKPGEYTKMNFPLAQAIPNVYGLAEAQTIFPYAIPEIDAPYLKPQTLNIQSQLQDIDNMGTAAVRSGADPMTAYIASMDAKQKAFQTKQNYDAEGRSRADIFNAQGKMQADQFNANAFNSVYNNLVAEARDAQSAEKQAAISNLVEKTAKHNQSENMKKWYFDNMVTSFDADGNNMNMTLNPDGTPTFSINKSAEKTTKTGKKGMLVSKKKSLTSYKK